MEININQILQQGIDCGASDIFVVAGLPLTFKVQGEQHRMQEQGSLSPQDTQNFAAAIYRWAGREAVCVQGSATDDDFSFSLAGVGRFRVNLYRQRGSIGAVVRVSRFGLPTGTQLPAAQLAAAAHADKKRGGSGITVVVPSALGAAECRRLTLEELDEWIADGVPGTAEPC